MLLTGPTGGLGRAVLAELGDPRPAGIALLGRDPVALADAVTQVPGAQSVPLDLASLASVREAALGVRRLVEAGHPPPTAVVLNAGVQTTDRRRTSADGLELTFGVNVLAQHALLAGLEPVLAPGARVVLLGSGTHLGDWHSYGLVPKPRWEDPEVLATPDPADGPLDPAGGPCAYSTSKLGVLYLAHAWQRRRDGLVVNVFDPGMMAGTGLARDQGKAARFAWKHVLPRLTVLPGTSSPASAAKHLVELALGERHPSLRGGYVEGDRLCGSSTESYDVTREDALWDWCEARLAREEHSGA